MDIAVAGAGPGGLAALMRSRAGHRVRLFERFETPRQSTGLAVSGQLLSRLKSLGPETKALREVAA